MSAQILAFTSRSRSRFSSRKGAADDTAPTVVILPCVRYERLSGCEPHDNAGAPEAAAQLAAAHH